MSEKPKFYLDEHISNDVVDQLRNRGIDVLATPEAGRKGKSDELNMEWALHEQRVIVTFDSDYIALHNAGKPHAGIAYFTEQARIGYIVNCLEIMHVAYTADEMIGRLEYL